MARRREKRLPVARTMCRHFVGSLAGCARGGLDALAARHRDRVPLLESTAACSVDLDHCGPATPDVKRWDYVISLLDSDDGIAIEPHHATQDEIERMIEKKVSAMAMLAEGAPTLRVLKWIWLTGSDEEPYFSNAGSAKARLAEAGISFPTRRLT